MALPREIRPSAVFEDVVATARLLDDRGEATSERGCLVSHTAEGFLLEADLAVAVRPLSAPWNDADASLESDPRPVEVLTRWGRSGVTDPALRLVAWTATNPWPHDAAVFVLTDRGVYSRFEHAAASSSAPRSVTDACAALDAPTRPLRAYVSAEAGVRWNALVPFLTCLDAHHVNVVLATFLPPSTRLPENPPAPRTPALCSEMSTRGEPDGVLTRDAILTGIAPLRAAAGACLGAATGASSGGSLVMRILVTPEGHVGDVCPVRDEIRDAGVVQCVLDLARGLTFDPPEPHGVVTFEIPLRWVGTRTLDQHALCAQSTPPSAMQ